MKKLTGAQIVIESLIAEGVDVIFGYPGGAILPTYDALLDSKIQHVLVRHEQGAAHMAEGYARVSGRPGVVMVTSGPGATNTVTGIADANMDSTPMVVISGQVPTTMIGNDALCLGMLGMHGSYGTNTAVCNTDCLVAIGARFDDRVTGRIADFAPHAKTIIHIDIDPSSISKNVKVDIPIVGDIKSVLADMLTVVKGRESIARRRVAWTK